MCSLLELVERCMVGQRGGKKTKTKLSKKSDALSSGPPAPKFKRDERDSLQFLPPPPAAHVYVLYCCRC
jgi:hypothetical protein